MSETDIIYSEQVKAEAARLGFCACGLAPAGPVAAPCADYVRSWLAAGCQGAMDYLERRVALRLDPCRLVEGARTVVAVALPYAPAAALHPDGYALARYALGRDYHDVVRGRLRELMAALGLEEDRDGRPFCDTAPVDERYWAVRCGLGWTGRNRLLVVPGHGSYVFLGELVVRRPADVYDTPMASRCGDCRRCLDACPTGALTEGGLDARRCLSYLTIEQRGPLPPDAGRQMGRCIYGCDRCAEACPWNRHVPPTTEPDFQPAAALRAMTAADWHRLSPEQYRALFRRSAVRRAKYEGLLRNIRAVEPAASAAGALLPAETALPPGGAAYSGGEKIGRRKNRAGGLVIPEKNS